MNIISFIKDKLSTKATTKEETIIPTVPIKLEEKRINEQDIINDIITNIDTIMPQEIITKGTILSPSNKANLLTNPLIKEKLTPYILEQYVNDTSLKKLKQKLTVSEIMSLLDLQSINEFYNKCIFEYKNSFEKYKIFSYLCTNKKESITLVNYLLTNNELFLEFIINITFYKDVFNYIDTELILKIILKLYSLNNEKYLYFFVTYLNVDTQKELIDANLDDNLLVNITGYLKPESIKYLFFSDKRINYLFPKINIMELIKNDTIFPNEILNNKKFFNILKTNSLVIFRKTINNLEKNNLPEPIENHINKYYEELINSYNEEYDMFNDYVYIINLIHRLNKTVNFNSYILDREASIIYNNYLNNKELNIINEYKKITSLKLSEIIIDYLFQDNIYNVWFNIKEMFRFNDKFHLLDLNKEEFYTTILNFDELSNKDKIKFYHTYKNEDINLMFYEDLRNTKDKSYEFINNQLFNYNNYNINLKLSLKYKTNIYDLRDQEFFMLVRGEKCHQETTSSLRNCYSIISNENTSVFGSGTITIYGYNNIDVDRVLHVYESDSYSLDLNEKKVISRIKVNRIMTPKELCNGSSWYSEIQIINQKYDNGFYAAKRPDYIVAINYINQEDVYESKRLNIPIVLIKKQLLEKNKMIDVKLTKDEEEYIDEYAQEIYHGKIHRLR